MTESETNVIWTRIVNLRRGSRKLRSDSFLARLAPSKRSDIIRILSEPASLKMLRLALVHELGEAPNITTISEIASAVRLAVQTPIQQPPPEKRRQCGHCKGRGFVVLVPVLCPQCATYRYPGDPCPICSASARKKWRTTHPEQVSLYKRRTKQKAKRTQKEQLIYGIAKSLTQL